MTDVLLRHSRVSPEILVFGLKDSVCEYELSRDNRAVVTSVETLTVVLLEFKLTGHSDATSSSIFA
jgi:hypothetical protein